MGLGASRRLGDCRGFSPLGVELARIRERLFDARIGFENFGLRELFAAGDLRVDGWRGRGRMRTNMQGLVVLDCRSWAASWSLVVGSFVDLASY